MRCTICERGCDLSPGRPGACGLYEEMGGEVRERFPDRYLVTCPISIETMPILHFFPGGKFLQISTAGCNFDCPGCISAVIVREMDPRSMALIELPPERVAELAVVYRCFYGIPFVPGEVNRSFGKPARTWRRLPDSPGAAGCGGHSPRAPHGSPVQPAPGP